MPAPTAGRVAVYIDFDNIVISRYDEVHGRGDFQRDRQRAAAGTLSEEEFAQRLEAATVDLGAAIDFASSFGTLVLTRAYADWSAPVNARYRGQLVGRAVDLVQLFPAAAYGKNGADIRLAVDAVEDMFRLPDLTHVVIVAGDSDYIALAQRCKRLGRYVIAVGVAGSTSRALAAACDELVTYDALPGAKEVAPPAQAEPKAKRPSRRAKSPEPEPEQPVEEAEDEDEEDPQVGATALLQRALRLGHDRGGDDADWLHNSQVKEQMKRLDPSFSERRLGYRSFSDFLRSRGELVDLDESSTARLVRLKG
ncbi:NYN domain-containing protein [Amnibacterium setariae]|uniref:NYN domain-containing protein n=1 Tax=Amnibacterium setariae TaxID=2306585 RepID=A0A3A1TYL0_9MICO|nr:NYN domain-containing protein [Amnibacterium setariae]